VSDSREAIVRSFLDSSASGDVEQCLGYFTPDVAARDNAWNEPISGIKAIRSKFERQRYLWSDFRYEVPAIATAGTAVLVERIDSVHMAGKDITIHAVGVFEVNDDGKIAAQIRHGGASGLASSGRSRTDNNDKCDVLAGGTPASVPLPHKTGYSLAPDDIHHPEGWGVARLERRGDDPESSQRERLRTE
jgi:limonene-1,2-epoxide hydrolase